MLILIVMMKLTFFFFSLNL